MMSSRFKLDSISVGLQKSWTSSFYGSMNGPGLRTLLLSSLEIYESNNRCFLPHILYIICTYQKIYFIHYLAFLCHIARRRKRVHVADTTFSRYSSMKLYISSQIREFKTPYKYSKRVHELEKHHLSGSI